MMIQRGQDSLFYPPHPAPRCGLASAPCESKHSFEVDTRPAEDASQELCEPMILAEEVGVARL